MERHLPTALLASLLASAAGAESVQLEEIVIKGERESTRQESLTIKEVRESPARDVGEALQQVEGVSTVRKGAIANDVVVRGFQRDNINVLVDGARLHGACPNRMDSPAFHYDFAEVEQVRILKGPYDLENPGSLGAVVDVKTRRPEKGPGFQANGTYGSYDAKNVSGVLSYGAPRFDGLLGYAYKDSEAPRDGDGERITDVYPAADPNGYQDDEEDSLAYILNTAWTKWGYNPTARSRVEIGYSYQDAQRVLYPYLSMDAVYDYTNRLNATLEVSDPTPAVAGVSLQAYWNDVTHLMDNSLRRAGAAAPLGYTMESAADTGTWGAKLGATFAVGRATLKGGLDYYDRNWDVETRLPAAPAALREQAMIPDVTTRNVGAYARYGRPLSESAELTLGARLDSTRVVADGRNAAHEGLFATYYGSSGDDAQDFLEVSGNLQLTFKPATGLEVFAGVGRGVRPPDAQELYIGLDRPVATQQDWVGNPDLDAPKNYQADLGAKVYSDRFYLNASLYYSYVDDYIDIVDIADPDPATPPALAGARGYGNVDARLWGFELGSQVSLPGNLFLKGALSFVHGRNESDGRALAEMPPLKGVAAVRYDDGTYFVEAAENFADEQDRVDEELQEERTAGWATTDLKAGFQFRSLSVYGGVNNLFDKFYYTHLSYRRDPFATGTRVPENGRNYYVTASLQF